MKKLKNSSSPRIGVSSFILMSVIMAFFAIIFAFIAIAIGNSIANA
jgi:hypothetical protein|tara:strand:+ start:434 stop:571 length:138 start_codon:yes stop_codon:yes gene_type:complete